MKNIFCFLLFATWVSISAQARVLDVIEPYLANPEIDVLHYNVRAKVAQMPPQQIDFETDLTLKTLTNNQTIELHVESSVLTVARVQSFGSDLAFNILPGKSNKYGLSGSVLEIALPQKRSAGQTLTLKIFYTVKKNFEADDKGLFYTAGGGLITRNWPYYGRFWLPSNDSPDDVANVEYHLEVPDGYMALGNGSLLKGDEHSGSGLQPSGLRLFEWEQKATTTVYNFIFGVGKFDLFKSEVCFNNDGEINDKTVDCARADRKIPLIVYYHKTDPEGPAIIKSVQEAALSAVYFSKLLGPFIFDKLGFVISPYPFAMESTSMIVLTGSKNAVHEVAHHWWGNNVHFAHWGDFWISEGFTTYFNGLYDEYKTGTNSSCLANPAEDLNHPANTDANDIFNSTPYCKGALALNTLRQEIRELVGKDVFLDLMSALYKQYKGGRLSSLDIVNFVDKNLVGILAAQGLKAEQEQVSALAEKWRREFIVIELAPQIVNRNCYFCI